MKKPKSYRKTTTVRKTTKQNSNIIYVGSPWAPMGRLTDHSPCNPQWVGGGWVVWEGWVLCSFGFTEPRKQQPNETKPPPGLLKTNKTKQTKQRKQPPQRRFVENKQTNKTNPPPKQRSTNYLRTFGYVPALII